MTVITRDRQEQNTRALWRYGLLRWPAVWLLALLIMAAWGEPLLVHRAFPHSIHLGDHDLGMTRGWSYKEWSDSLPSSYGPVTSTYRWSGSHSWLLFEHVVQGQPQLATLRLLSGRPDRGPTPATVSVDGQVIATLAVHPTLRSYHLLVPGELVRDRSLSLLIETPTFRTEGDDARNIGVIGLEARLEELGTAPWLPRPTFPLFVLSLGALLMLNGQSLGRALVGATVGFALAAAAGLAVPWATLSAIGTLAELFVIAAVVVGAYRLWQRWPARPSLRYPWAWAGVMLLLITLITFTPSMSSDGVEYYAYLRSLAIDRDLEFTNEFSDDVPFDNVPTWLAKSRTPTGYARNLASVGPAVIWTPFYLVGSAIIFIGNQFGAGWTTDGYALPHIALINLAGVAALALTIWLGYRSVRSLVAHEVALLASGAMVVGTAIMYFDLINGDFPHGLAAASVAAFFFWWLRTRPERTLRQWIVLGIFAGLMSMMYWINAILLLLPALDMLPLFWKALRERNWRGIASLIGQGLVFLAALLVAFSPQMIVWTVLFGSPLTIPHGSGFAGPKVFKPLEMLFSPVHSLLLWGPISFVALLGMGWYVARRKWEGFLVLTVFTLYFLYNATLSSWHGGGPFGPRRIANVLPLLTPGLALLLDALARRWRYAPLTLCAICVTWSTAVLLRYLAYIVPHHPSDLKALRIDEFILAPNNLPWSMAGSLIKGRLFPRMFLEVTAGEGSPLQLGLLLAAAGLVITITIYAIARLHSREVAVR